MSKTICAHAMSEWLIGTGGWAYFNAPGRPSLAEYSKLFNFVEVNYTFYEYPDTRTVERWRRTVPRDFTFAVRCHQDLTHRIGLKPVDEAYAVLAKMRMYCGLLNSPFLVLETPSSYAFGEAQVEAARNFLSSANLRSLQLVWELRAQLTPKLASLMSELGIVQCIDLSREKPAIHSDVAYSRLFGKGKHNLYQFTDAELTEINDNALKTGARIVAMAYHGLRMNTDAVRFKEYKKTGTFLPVTSFVGIDSAKAVLKEDASFPASKRDFVQTQGWKVIDLTKDKRVHLSELLAQIPDRNYASIDELLQVLEASCGENWVCRV